MKCSVDGCLNESWQGQFIGNLCTPCHTYFSSILKEHEEAKSSRYSQAYKNNVELCKEYLKNCEIFEIREKYK